MSKILVIDDERAIRNTLKEILEYEKHEVDLAEDGTTGIDLFQKNCYEVVLCDIKMPQMDGIEVLEKLLELSSETPVIMISGHGNIDTAVEAIKKGAFDFRESFRKGFFPRHRCYLNGADHSFTVFQICRIVQGFQGTKNLFQLCICLFLQ